MKKRSIAYLLILCMLMGLFPANAFAQEQVEQNGELETTEKDFSQKEEKIEQETKEPPKEQAPSEEDSTGEPPEEQIPTEEDPTGEPPEEQIPTEEDPTGEPPEEQIPTEEDPTEEPPKEQAPSEEDPTEELPEEELTEEILKQKDAIQHGEICNGNHDGWTKLDNTMTSLGEGMYFLENAVTISQTIEINGDVTLCLNGQTLEMTGSDSVMKVKDSRNLTLFDEESNAGVITGGERSGIYVDENANFMMKGGSISKNEANEANGGGVYVAKNANFTMLDGIISENITGEGTRQEKGGAGGGVYVDGGTFEMEGGIISGNCAYGHKLDSTFDVDSFGGGVCVLNEGSFTMSGDSAIQGENYSKISGGGVYIKDSNFTMTGGTISENSTGNSGGGVYVYNGTTFTMTNGTISKNHSGVSGGGICIQDTQFTMTNSTISENEAKMGGGIYAVISEVVMQDSSISENEAKNSGGGVLIGNTSEFEISGNSIITGNKVTDGGHGSGGGGVIVGSQSTFTIKDTSKITNNIVTVSNADAASGGGGVYVSGGTFIMSDNSEITENEVDVNTEADSHGGGGVFVYNGTFHMETNSKIAKNVVNRYGTGGGISVVSGTIQGTTEANFLMEGGIITENEAKKGAGVSIINIELPQKSDSKAMVTMRDGTISNNISESNGGGVFIMNGGYAESDDVIFTMEGGEISENEAAYNGGGVFIDGWINQNNYYKSTFLMKDGIISGNKTTKDGYGGGMSVSQYGIFKMQGGTIKENETLNSGGGIDLSGSFTMTGGSIVENTSAYSGGGIYVNPDALIYVSGTPIIKENIGTEKKSVNNVYLPTDNIIHVIDALEKSANIGVSVGAKDMDHRKIAEGNNPYTIADGTETKFRSDHPEYKTILDSAAVFLEKRPENEKIVTFNYLYNDLTETKIVEVGTPVVAPTPQRDGYTLEGWYIDETLTQAYDFNTAVTEDMILYAKWMKETSPPPETQKFTIQFNANGGTPVPAWQEVEEGGTVRKPDTPKKTGYQFKGWYIDETLTQVYDFNTEVTEDMTLYAKWTEETSPPSETQKFTIQFNANGGTPVPAWQEVEEGGTVRKPDTPKKTGYQFKSWYIDETLTQVYDFNTAVTEDMILYAGWEPTGTVKSYIVTFESNGGSEIPSQTVETGKTAVIPEVPKRSGYEFLGWFADKEFHEIYRFSNPVTENLTLYAKWKSSETVESYVVTFESNGGSEIPSQTVETGKTAVIPEVPRKNGYEFLGWFADKEFHEIYRFSNPVTENLTLYAKWKSSGTVESYVVTFESNGGSEIPSQTVETGKTAVIPEVPRKNGYEFLGWFADKEFHEIYRFSNPVTENFTLYAKWKWIEKSHSSGGGGGSYRTGTWVKPEKQTIQPQVIKQGCPRNQDCPLIKFTDVDRYAWYHDGSHYCVENDLIFGTTNTTFSPHMPITRSMVVTILWRTENKPIINDSIPFYDVTEGEYYTEAVRWAVHNDIVSGYSNIKFAPEDSITREQMAAMLYRYTQYKNKEVSGKADISMYEDMAEVSHYALDAIQWACDTGIINGVSTTMLSPKGTTTRAQAAQMFYMLKKID